LTKAFAVTDEAMSEQVADATRPRPGLILGIHTAAPCPDMAIN